MYIYRNERSAAKVLRNTVTETRGVAPWWRPRLSSRGRSNTFEAAASLQQGALR